MMRFRGILLPVAALAIFIDGVQAQNGATALLESPVKVEPETAQVGETVVCTLALPGALFGADQIRGTTPSEFVGDELYNPFTVSRFDEHCNSISSWSTAFPGTTMTGITWDDRALPVATYWVVDSSISGTILEYVPGLGVPTGRAWPLALGLPGPWGPAAIDYNQAGEIAYIEDIGGDLVVEIDLATGFEGCSFPNPDNASGSGAYGNGLSEAADPSACGGATMVLTSGTDTEGQVTRASQTDCSGTLCMDTWDVVGPTAPFGETWPEGFEEFMSSVHGDKRALVMGNSTGLAYVLAHPVGIFNCQGIDSPDSDLLYVNIRQGEGDYVVEMNNVIPLCLSVQKPPAGGNGKFFVHMNDGVPSAGTITAMGGGLGDFCFPYLIAPYGSADPVSVWNNVGAKQKVGRTNYFGTEMADPAKAPACFWCDPDGDPANLTLGSRWTLQGIIHNPAASSPKGFSVTNAVIADVTAGI